jgi:hypothetical protein
MQKTLASAQTSRHREGSWKMTQRLNGIQEAAVEADTSMHAVLQRQRAANLARSPAKGL